MYDDRDSSGKRIPYRILLTLILCAAALAARIQHPDAARTLETWLIGPEGNPVVQAFAGMEYAMGEGGGIGQAVQVFCTEMTGDAPS